MVEEIDCGDLNNFEQEECPVCGFMTTGFEGSFNCPRCGHKWDSEEDE